jgi:hypothetical protein
MADRSKTVLTLVIGAVVGIGPAYFGYLQSRDELKVKYQQTQDEATSGYAALAASVKELQTAVTVQHDYIVKLEANVSAMNQLVTIAIEHINSTPDVHTHVPRTDKILVPTATPPVHERPKFRLVPGDFDAAVKEYGAR